MSFRLSLCALLFAEYSVTLVWADSPTTAPSNPQYFLFICNGTEIYTAAQLLSAIGVCPPTPLSFTVYSFTEAYHGDGGMLLVNFTCILESNVSDTEALQQISQSFATKTCVEAGIRSVSYIPTVPTLNESFTDTTFLLPSIIASALLCGFLGVFGYKFYVHQRSQNLFAKLSTSEALL